MHRIPLVTDKAVLTKPASHPSPPSRLPRFSPPCNLEIGLKKRNQGPVGGYLRRFRCSCRHGNCRRPHRHAETRKWKNTISLPTIHNGVKRLLEMLEIGLRQQATDNWGQWSTWVKWVRLMVPVWGTLIFFLTLLTTGPYIFKSLFTLFPRGSLLLSRIPPQTGQLNPIPSLGLLQLSNKKTGSISSPFKRLQRLNPARSS
jgi:hypothetical protein